MRLEFVDKYTTIDGISVRYWDEWEGESVFLVHGLGVSLETWAWTIEALAAEYRVVAMDLPASGKSSRPTRDDFYSLTYGSTFLRRLADRLGIDGVSLVGNSMGGALAIQYAIDYPSLINRLVLVDSAGLGKEVHWSVTLMTVPLANRVFAHPPRILADWVTQHIILRHDASTEMLIHKITEYSKVPGSREAAVKMVRSGADLWGQKVAFSASQLAQINAPTLIVWGDRDFVIPQQHALVALKSIRDCRAVVLSRAGHGPQIDNPETFNALILEFLAAGRLSREDGHRRVIRI